MMKMARVGAHSSILSLRSVSIYLIASLSNLCFVHCLLCYAEMDLFRVVRAPKPLDVTVGSRQLAEGELPVLQANAGHTMELVVEEPEQSESVPQDVVPEQMIAPIEAPVEEPVEEPEVQGPVVQEHAASSSSVREVENPDAHLGKKRTASEGDDEGTSKRRRVLSAGADSEGAENSRTGPEIERVSPYG